MKNNIIYFVLFLFFTACIKTSNTPLNLVTVMQKADSLNLLSDSATISNYTRKNLIPLFHLYNNSKKAIILKYLTKSKEKNNLFMYIRFYSYRCNISNNEPFEKFVTKISSV